MNRDEALTEIRDRTASLVTDLRTGTATVAEVASLVAQRQELVDGLGVGDEELTPRARKLVTEIALLDRYVLHWCSQSQSEIAAQLVAHRPRPAAPSAARIISQSA